MMIFQDDLQWMIGLTGVPIYGDTTQSEANYLGNLNTPGWSGNRAAADPWRLIDGANFDGVTGGNSASTYQDITEPQAQTATILGQLIAGFEGVWNNSSLGRGMVSSEWGFWSLPDNRGLDGTLDAGGRFPSLHGTDTLNKNSAFRSLFAQEFYDAHCDRALFQPLVSPMNPEIAVSSQEITVAPFGYVQLSGVTRGDQTQTPADGTYPYISSGVTFRYTLDGSEPTASSTLYNGASKPVVTAANANGDGNVVFKVKAFADGYEASATLTSMIPIANFIRQTKNANSMGISVGSIAATFDQMPLDGSAIFAQASVRLRSEALTLSDNETAGAAWSYVHQNATSPSGAFGYKVANGTSAADPTPTTITATNPGTDGRMQISIMEVVNLDLTTLSASATNLTTPGTAAQTKSTGTTGSLAAGNYLAIAAWSGDDDGTILTGPAYNPTSFDEADGTNTNLATASRALGVMAVRQFTGGGTLECTADFGSANFRGVGGMAVFAVADTDPPVLTEPAVAANGATLTLDFNEPMDEAGTLAGLSLTGDGNNAQTYNLSSPVWSESSTRLTATLSSTANATQNDSDTGEPLNSLFLAYDDATGDLTDAAGNPLASFAAFQVTNNSEQGVSQYLSSQIGADASLSVNFRYNDTDEFSVPESGHTIDLTKLTVTADGDPVALSGGAAFNSVDNNSVQIADIATEPTIKQGQTVNIFGQVGFHIDANGVTSPEFEELSITNDSGIPPEVGGPGGVVRLTRGRGGGSVSQRFNVRVIR